MYSIAFTFGVKNKIAMIFFLCVRNINISSNLTLWIKLAYKIRQIPVSVTYFEIQLSIYTHNCLYDAENIEIMRVLQF